MKLRSRTGIVVAAAATVLLAIAAVPSASAHQGQQHFPSSRNALTWPFSRHSIWNTPVGSRAQYRNANLSPATQYGPTVDENVIIMRPHAPQQNIVETDAGWDSSKTRCGSVVPGPVVLYRDVPITHDFVTDPGYLGLTPNQSAAILRADGRTAIQTEPFHRCAPGGLAVSQYKFPDADIYTGDGIRGAHGGSGLSSLGGTIRVGELRPGSVIHHALEMNVFGREDLASCAITAGHPYRWPAVTADGYACDPNSSIRYGGADPGVVQGTLLALKPDFDVAQLRTEPARIIATALKNYGAYIADDTAWSTYAFETEWGPSGRVSDQVQRDYGITIGTPLDTTNPADRAFNDDIATIVANMSYVANNGPRSIGGGGRPRQPLAPPFCQDRRRLGCQ